MLMGKRLDLKNHQIQEDMDLNFNLILSNIMKNNTEC